MYYVHHIDPVLLPLWGPLAIRWYGLAYLAGIVGGYLMLNHWGRRGRYPVSGERLQSFMIAIVIGIMAGGRLGHVFFYDWAAFVQDPAMVFRLWEGGMSSHGGMIGLTLATLFMSRKLQSPFLSLADGLAAVAPLGLGLGRLANFINGELWGRVTTVPWAVIFPQEAGISSGEPGASEVIELYISRGLLSPRHPSQLYQAMLEGVVMWLVLVLAYRSPWGRAGAGRTGGLFLVLYTVVRVIAEIFREPEVVYFGWITHGQLLSVVLLLPGGIYLIARTYRRRA